MRDVIIPRAKANGVHRITVLGTASYELPSEQVSVVIGQHNPILLLATGIV